MSDQTSESRFVANSLEPVATHAASMEEEERRRFNALLLERAQKEQLSALSFNKRTVETQYDAELKHRANETASYLRGVDGFYKGATDLPVNKIDAAVAVGVPASNAISSFLAFNQLSTYLIDKDIKQHTVRVKEKQADLYEPFISQFGTRGFGLASEAQGNLDRECVVTPAPLFVTNPLKQIEGLSEDVNRRYTNSHEHWHCKDVRKHPPRLDGEVFADIGSLGDLVREGEDLSTIDKVAAWRRKNTLYLHDGDHDSEAALRLFKSEIEKMGVDKFRKLSSQEAESFYYTVAEAGVKDIPTKGDRLYEDMVGNVQSGFLSLGGLVPALEKMMDSDIGAKAKEKEESASQITNTIKKWDAMEEMQDVAFKNSGKITPATMIDAYYVMQDELYKKAKDDPQNGALYAEKYTKLRRSFVLELNTVDFVTANEKRGVDIRQVEKTLSADSQQAVPAQRIHSVQKL